MTVFRLMLVTVPHRELAGQIARALVEERLAACVNVVPGLRSIYRWRGQVEEDDELLLIIKTRQERVADVEARVIALHSYDTPEVISLAIEAGSARYLDWLAGQVEE